jgi:hypothetical protein
MDLELHNVYTVATPEGVKLFANVVAVGYRDRTGDEFACATSCWADVLTTWSDPSNADPLHIVRKYLVKQGIESAKATLEQAKAYAVGELAQAQALLDDDPDKAAKVQAAMTWQAQLNGFASLMNAEIPVRVDSFYSALKAFHNAKGETERAAQVQAEWDTWHASHPDTTGLEGAVLA